MVVSICECPSIFCTCSIGIPLSIALVAIVLRNLYETPQSEFLGQAPQKTISVEKNNHIEDTEAVVEESLSLEEKEKEMIVKALEKNHGKRKLAAQDLGISERTLYRKLKEYDIEI